jgi:WD40 repeat protein
MKPHTTYLAILLALSFQTLFAQFRAIPQLGHNNHVIALQYSPDGKYLATAGHDHVILLWDTRTNLHFPLHAHAVGVERLAFSPDSKSLVSTDFAGNLIVWDLQTRKPVSRITNNSDEDAFFKIQFINNDEIALLNSKMFKFWNFKTNAVTRRVPLKATQFTLHPKEPIVLLLEQKNDLSASGGYSVTSKMVLFDMEKQAPVDDSWIRKIGGEWSRGEFSATGKYLALTNGRELALLDYGSKKLLWKTEMPIAPQAFMITPDEAKIIFSGNLEQPDLFIYDRATGKQLQQTAAFTDFGFAYNHQQQIIAGSHNPSEDAYVFQAPISIYDLKSKVVIKAYQYSNYTIEQIAWNDQNKQLFVRGYDGIWVWDLTLANIMQSEVADFNQEIEDWKLGTTKLRYEGGSVYLSPGKKYKGQINGARGGIEVTDNKTGQTIFTLPEGLMMGVAFSHDNQKLFRSTGDDIFTYDLSTKQQVKQLHYDKASTGALACSANGKFLAVGKFQNEYTEIKEKFYAADYSIDLLDPTTMQMVNKLEGHTANVTSLEFTPDSKYLISSSLDGSIRFWDLASGKQKFILYGNSPDEYFIQAEEGYYSSSKSGIDRIAFDYKNSIVPGKLFETQMNRPDQVAEKLGYANPSIVSALKKAFEKRISQLGITEQQIKIEELPQLTITNFPAPSVNSKTIQVSYDALDNLNELNNIKVLVNNVPVYGRKGLSVKTKKAVKGKLDIELTEGLNTVQLSVVNAKGISSLPVTFEVFCSVASIPDLYLITIGIDKFLDPEYNLNYAEKDASDIAALFESKKAGYGKVVHLPFHGINATKEKLLAVRSILEKTKVDDQVIIFAATHGLLDDKYDYYLATYNMVFDQPAFMGLAYNELEGLLDQIPARKKLMLLDACHSGEVDASEITASTEAVKSNPGVKARGFKPVKKVSNLGIDNTFDLMKNMFADLREGTGTTVISSAAGVEFAIESEEWSNGAFTASLLEGIKTKAADQNQDAKISVNELKNFVFKRVSEITNGKQHPTSRIENIDNNFDIISTVATAGKATEILGNWNAIEIDQYNDGNFEKLTEGNKKSPITITKGADGFYYLSYGAGGMKLLPVEDNGFKGPSGFVVKGETDSTLVIYDSYMGNVRYTKAK